MNKIINLDPWQKEVLEYEGDILLCTGRRVGKTEIMAQKCIEYMRKHRGSPIIIVSLTEEQAQIIMSMALFYAQTKYPGLVGKGKKKPLQKKLYFNEGLLSIRCVGNNSDGVRGFEGGVLYVDEASRMTQQFWTSAKPVILTTSGHIWMSSTPQGKKGYFWERFNESVNKRSPDARFRVWYVTTEEVINNRKISSSWTEEQRKGALRILAEDKREMSELEYGQEYLGLFLEDIQNFFEEDWIKQVCTEYRKPEPTEHIKRFLGCDIGRRYDPSTYEDFGLFGDNVIQLDSQETQGQTTDVTQDKIKALNDERKYNKIGIDMGSGALGVGVGDNLINKYHMGNIVPMNNRQIALDREGKSKQKMLKVDGYNYLKALGEQGKLKLLKDDKIIASLRSVQFEIKDEEDHTQGIRIFGSNTHHAEGIWRAVYLTKEKSLNLWAAWR